MIPLLLSWRYAWSRVVNLIAVLAVALVLTVQIVVMGVLDGMLADMERRVRGLGEQITLHASGAPFSAADLPALEEALADLPEVAGVTPLTRGYGMLEKDGLYAPVILYGIDLERELRFSALPQHLQEPFDPDGPAWSPPGQAMGGLDGLFLGAEAAERLGAAPGDAVRFHYASGQGNELVRRRFVVGNIYRSGSPLKDEWGGFIPLPAAQKLFLDAPPDREPVTTFAVWLHRPEEADVLEGPVLARALAALGREEGGIRSYTWRKRWRTLSAGMAHENRLQEIVLGLMTLSGGFCVFAILATLASRRGRDIGLLRCLGAGRGSLVLVFLLVGFWIGAAGAVAGLAGGYFAAPRIDGWWEALTGEPLYPPYMFLVTGLTVKIVHWKAVLYAGGAVLIAVLAAAYPALWAGSREPMEALRDE